MSVVVCPAAVAEDAGSRSYLKTKVRGAMKEAKPGNLHYIFLQGYVNEPIISMRTARIEFSFLGAKVGGRARVKCAPTFCRC